MLRTISKIFLLLFFFLGVAISFQNCGPSGVKFSTVNFEPSQTNTDSAKTNIEPVAPSSDRGSSNTTNNVATADPKVKTENTPLPSSPIPSSCECEFSLKVYFNQGYSTTFYSKAGKIYEPSQTESKTMRLPGDMKDEFYISKADDRVFFSCQKGLLTYYSLNITSGLRSESASSIALAPDCPNVDCKFKLENGYQTTFVTSKTGKIYQPDALGNMSLPGDFNPYDLNTWNAIGNHIYYRCEKGILTTYDNALHLISTKVAN